MSEVEEWLNLIGLPELFLYFEEDGWVTLDGLTLMTEDDVKAITVKRGHIAIILREIDRLRFSVAPPQNVDHEVTFYDNQFNDDYSIRPSRRESKSRRGTSVSRAASAPPKTLDEMYTPYIYAKYGFSKKYGRASHGKLNFRI
jgi:hypothetical protein